MSENIQEDLKLPPGTCVYSPIQMDTIEMELDKALAKARWELRSREEREDCQTEEEFLAERVGEMTLLDRGKKVLDLSKLRVTDLPTNGEVIIPEDRPPREEMQLQSFKLPNPNIVFQTSHAEIRASQKTNGLRKPTSHRNGLAI